MLGFVFLILREIKYEKPKNISTTKATVRIIPDTITGELKLPTPIKMKIFPAIKSVVTILNTAPIAAPNTETIKNRREKEILRYRE